jgi:hypothetical protein
MGKAHNFGKLLTVGCTVGKSIENNNGWLKVTLWLLSAGFAAGAAALIFFSGSAATVTGSSPFAAISMVEGVNTGILGPGEERWFRFVPGQNGEISPVEKALTLVITPGTQLDVNRVSMQIFEDKRIRLFFLTPGGRMANIGAGQLISRDHNPDTGELFWAGWLPGQQVHYLQLTNSNNIPADYWLFTGNVDNYNLGQPAAPAAPVEALPAPAVAAVPAVNPPAAGLAPNTAQSLQMGRTKGRLSPGQETWFTFALPDTNGAGYESLALTLVFTPDDGNRVRQIGLDLLTAASVQRADLPSVGRGSIVFRDNNPLTGEQIWSGAVIDGDTYYLRLQNNSPAQIDFWLFTGDVFAPALD